jgi:transposase-like protein
MEAIRGRKTIQEIAADPSIHSIQLSQWKRQLLESASELFGQGKKNKDEKAGERGQGSRALSADRQPTDRAGVTQKDSQLL